MATGGGSCWFCCGSCVWNLVLRFSPKAREIGCRETMEAEGRVLRTSPDVPFVFASLEARHMIATAELGSDSIADDVKKALRNFKM